MICVISVFGYEDSTVLDIAHNIDEARAAVEHVARKVGMIDDRLGYEVREGGTKPKCHFYRCFEGEWYWETETAVGKALKAWRAARKVRNRKAS